MENYFFANTYLSGRCGKLHSCGSGKRTLEPARVENAHKKDAGRALPYKGSPRPERRSPRDLRGTRLLTGHAHDALRVIEDGRAVGACRRSGKAHRGYGSVRATRRTSITRIPSTRSETRRVPPPPT
ncbi:protein of unknown function [Burkholderia multivorans]